MQAKSPASASGSRSRAYEFRLGADEFGAQRQRISQMPRRQARASDWASFRSSASDGASYKRRSSAFELSYGMQVQESIHISESSGWEWVFYFRVVWRWGFLSFCWVWSCSFSFSWSLTWGVNPRSGFSVAPEESPVASASLGFEVSPEEWIEGLEKSSSIEGLERASLAFIVVVGSPLVVEFHFKKYLREVCSNQLRFREICYNQLRCWVSFCIPWWKALPDSGIVEWVIDFGVEEPFFNWLLQGFDFYGSLPWEELRVKCLTLRSWYFYLSKFPPFLK